PLRGHRIIRRGEPDEAAQFALAVALAQRALELVPPRHLELRGYRASARQAEPQRDRWPPAPGTLVEHVPEYRRVGRHHGGPHSLGRLPTRLCGPAGHHARGPAGMKDWKKVRYELIGARQGRRSEAHVLRPEPEAFGDATGRPHGRFVGQAGTLWRSRRARRVGQVSEIALLGAVRRRDGRTGEQLGPPDRSVLGSVEAHVVLD